MSIETQQFLEIVRIEYALLQFGELERQEILLNIAESELDGEITRIQAQELRRFYDLSRL